MFECLTVGLSVCHSSFYAGQPVYILHDCLCVCVFFKIGLPVTILHDCAFVHVFMLVCLLQFCMILCVFIFKLGCLMTICMITQVCAYFHVGFPVNNLGVRLSVH